MHSAHTKLEAVWHGEQSWPEADEDLQSRTVAIIKNCGSISKEWPDDWNEDADEVACINTCCLLTVLLTCLRLLQYKDVTMEDDEDLGVAW